jgi:small subunit ribosomal protein S20
LVEGRDCLPRPRRGGRETDEISRTSEGVCLSELTLAAAYSIIGAENKEKYMAHHNSAVRQRRRSIRRNAINRQNKSTLRTQVKKLREAIQKGDKEAAQKLVPSTVSLIDKSVKKGSIHKNRGARFKSRLTRQVGMINPSPSK